MNKKRLARQQARYHLQIKAGTKCAICKWKLATELHHENYDNALDVLMLCWDCHKQIHKNRRKF